MTRALLIGTGVLVFGILAATLRTFGLGKATAQDLDVKPNSCVISCPAGSAYPNLGGGVGCAEGYAPVCQCATAEVGMAACQRLAAKP